MGQISDALGTAILSVAGLFKYLVAVLLVPVFTVSFQMCIRDSPEPAQIKNGIFQFALMKMPGMVTYPMDYSYYIRDTDRATMTADYRSGIVQAYKLSRMPWNIGHHLRNYKDGVYFEAMKDAFRFAAQGCPDAVSYTHLQRHRHDRSSKITLIFVLMQRHPRTGIIAVDQTGIRDKSCIASLGRSGLSKMKKSFRQCRPRAVRLWITSRVTIALSIRHPTNLSTTGGSHRHFLSIRRTHLPQRSLFDDAFYLTP